MTTKANSRHLQRLFEDFQGRSLRKAKEVSIESSLPAEVYEFGIAESVLYYCDKRDPGDPHGEGAQGHWKHFIHKHSKGVGIYMGISDPDSEPQLGKQWSPSYPESAAWLGELKEIVYTSIGGKKHTEKFTGTNLWVWDDRRTLMALPKGLGRSIKPEDVMLWRGGRLKVTKRGIEH